MQGNRDGSWSLPSSGNVNNNTVPSGYLPPQANSLFSNFNQPIRYPLTQYTPNLYSRIFPDFSLGSPNFQPQQNLSFHHQQIPHQFSNNANVFLQSHGPSSFSFPPQSIPNHDIRISQNSEAFESSSLKRRREEVDLVLKETPISSFVPGESANESGVSRIHGGKGSSDKSSSKSKSKVELQRIDKSVNKTRESIIGAGESVSSTRVTQLVLEQLQADSWRSLGVQMQDVPSLRQLMALEGKINAFIHCFVGARRIVTLHDLEVAICRAEFVESFDDLELGPLLQHPLVLLYFPSISSSTGPVQITSEEIISFLDSYLHTYMTEDVKLDEFLNFVASQKSVTSKEKLGVRIQSLRMYVSFILDAKRQEGETLKFLLTELHQKYHIPSSKKQRQDKSLTVSERADSFALRHKDYCGKHTRFNASSSDDNDSDDNEVENLNSSDHINSCPYPSVAEEMKRLGGSNKKRKGERRNHEKSDSSKLPRKSPSKLRGHKKQEIPKLADDSDAKKVFGVNETDFTLSEGDLRLFISTWKDTCKELSISTFVEKMLSFYNSGGSEGRAQMKRAKAMSSLPFVGLLNVADKALYTTPDLDSHSMFMELSRLFFNGVPDLQLANFLHLIKTMAESGMSEEQLESFILNSQNIHQIPDGEKIWSLKSAIKTKKKAGISLSWLPSSSKTGHNSKEELASSQISSSEENVTETLKEQIPIEITGYDNSAGTSSRASEPNPLHSMHMQIASTSGNQAININPNLHEWNNSFSAHFSERDQLHTGTPWAVQAQQTGKKGEEIAYRYFAAKYGKEALVRWVNEQSETGLPYDLMIENRGGKKEYVEVKATVSTRKDFFNLTVREWQFANEKGESYIIAHVLLGNSNAIITQHRNPVKLCQEGHLRLLVLMPNQRNEVNVAF
ncbi:Protein NO VEIN [Cardamine amara subsp. amara]|uniref:Protein NO VEIN n=1 Tax=Cardamine amara subsp. amara TaxID=228776 RepID=A0ABD1B6Z9_CARAN